MGRSLVRGGTTPASSSGGVGGGAPTDATYIVQTGHGDLSAEQALSTLATGLVKVTNGTGVLSTATAGTDYAEASHTHTLADITDDGTMAAQNAGSVAITGGSVTGITDLAIADGGTGASTATAAFDALAPTTTEGDLIYHNGTDNVRLAKGTALQVLRMNSGATAPEWGGSYFRTIHGCGVAAGFQPPDSSSIYFGRWNIFDPSTSYVTHAFEVDLVGMVLVAVHCVVIIATNSGNPASNVTLSIRKNDTTDTTLGTAVPWSTPSVIYTDTNVNGGSGVSFAAGDDFCFKFATPNWTTTNPSPCFVSLIATWRSPS